MKRYTILAAGKSIPQVVEGSEKDACDLARRVYEARGKHRPVLVIEERPNGLPKSVRRIPPLESR